MRDVLFILQGRTQSVMKWEDISRTPYKTKEEADAAGAKVDALIEQGKQRDAEYRKAHPHLYVLADMIERHRAERKALEEELERTLPQRARDAAYREYLYKFPPGTPEETN